MCNKNEKLCCTVHNYPRKKKKMKLGLLEVFSISRVALSLMFSITVNVWINRCETETTWLTGVGVSRIINVRSCIDNGLCYG